MFLFVRWSAWQHLQTNAFSFSSGGRSGFPSLCGFRLAHHHPLDTAITWERLPCPQPNGPNVSLQPPVEEEKHCLLQCRQPWVSCKNENVFFKSSHVMLVSIIYMYIITVLASSREAWVSNLRLWVREVPAQTTFCPSFLLGILAFFPSHSGRLRGLCHLGLPSIHLAFGEKIGVNRATGFSNVQHLVSMSCVACCQFHFLYVGLQTKQRTRAVFICYVAATLFPLLGLWGLARVPSPKRKQAQLIVRLTAGSLVSR
jgi:hypothetical protein